jgi:hypothetical protein
VREADLIVLATGYQSQESVVREMLGDRIADRVGPDLGHRAEWRDCQHVHRHPAAGPVVHRRRLRPLPHLFALHAMGIKVATGLGQGPRDLGLVELMLDFTGKVALVTGRARWGGLGQRQGDGGTAGATRRDGLRAWILQAEGLAGTTAIWTPRGLRPLAGADLRHDRQRRRWRALWPLPCPVWPDRRPGEQCRRLCPR